MENHLSQETALVNYTPIATRITQNLFNVCCSVVNGRPMYEFAKCLEFLEATGKELFEEKFIILKDDHEVIYKLLLYIIGDNENAFKHGLSLKKGLLLTGPVGCGKTSLIKLPRFFQPLKNQYCVRSCREIIFSFIRDGYDVIHQYTYGYIPEQFKVYCFDDLGVESSLKYYGNQCNVLGEILLTRYELFVAKGLLTHATTNCNSSENENFYGNRVRSRMREMFNLVAFDKEAKDKR